MPHGEVRRRVRAITRRDCADRRTTIIDLALQGDDVHMVAEVPPRVPVMAARWGATGPEHF